MKTPIFQLSFLIGIVLLVSSMQIVKPTGDDPKLSTKDTSLIKVVKSENEWKKILSPTQLPH